VFKNPKADLSQLTPSELERMVALTEPPKRPGTLSGLTSATAGAALPAAASSVLNFATSPTVPKTAATIGRVAGAVSPPLVGAYEGGPIGFIAGLAGSAKGAWAGSKTGWHTGKLAQWAAKPVASALDAAAPYAQGLSTIGGAQGVNDLAQMAEPNRKDIGFLGLAPSVNVPGAKPPLINALYEALLERLQR
jgi:hypothetical protein